LQEIEKNFKYLNNYSREPGALDSLTGRKTIADLRRDIFDSEPVIVNLSF
jgi:hypothetical protein